MEKERLEEFNSVKNWKRSLRTNSRKGILTERTWDIVIVSLFHYLTFINSGPDAGMNPDELLDESLRDPDKTKSRLILFFDWLQGGKVEGHKPKSRKVKHNSALVYLARVRGFYTHNKVVFGKWKMMGHQRL